MRKEKNCKLNITLVNGDSWILGMSRKGAENIMKEFHYKLFKRGSLIAGNFNRGEKVQVFNIKHICSMAIQEEDE